MTVTTLSGVPYWRMAPRMPSGMAMIAVRISDVPISSIVSGTRDRIVPMTGLPSLNE